MSHLEFTLQDVVFELGNVVAAFVYNYEGTGWPGLVIQITVGGQVQTVKAPLDVMHAVQMCSFNFTSIVKKVEEQDLRIEQLRDQLNQGETAAADVIPFKPRSV